MSVRGRLAADGGSAVVELSWLTVLLLVPLIYLVLMLARVQAGSYAVTQAAREAGRSFVTGAEDRDAERRARAAADIAFADQGFTGEGGLTIVCTTSPCLSAGGAVTTTARVEVPLPLIPGVARAVVPLSVPVSAGQTSPVPGYEARR